MISSIKLFYLDGTAMVAVYGGDHEGDDDWLCNLPAGEVVLGDPAALPAEQMLPIAAARTLVTFAPGFRRRLLPKPPVMLRQPQLVQSISSSTGIPAPLVRRIVTALFQQLAGLVETGGQLESPQLRIRPRTTSPRAATETKPARPASRFALLLPKSPQSSKK
jgi:hypothetical protein